MQQTDFTGDTVSSFPRTLTDPVNYHNGSCRPSGGGGVGNLQGQGTLTRAVMDSESATPYPQVASLTHLLPDAAQNPP